MPTELPGVLVDALSPHIPPDANWIVTLAPAVVGLLGLVIILMGARLARVFTALACAGLVAAVGALAHNAVTLPLWPTVGVSAAAGLVIGALAFRAATAALVAAGVVAVALGVYSAQAVLPALDEYEARGLNVSNTEAPVSMPPEQPEAASGADTMGKLEGVWAYLSERVPHLGLRLAAIALSTGLAGLVFGFLLPRTARACAAATVGTALLAGAAFWGVRAHWPQAGSALDQWGLYGLGGLWAVSLTYNLLSSRARPRKPVAAPAQAAS
jgi:hypothetical protein